MPGHLTEEQNERLRTILQDYLKKQKLIPEDLARALGVHQSALSKFLNRVNGASLDFVGKVARLTKRTEWDLLGTPAPALAQMSARDLAAHVAREGGVGEKAIAVVLARPLTAETRRWPTIYFLDEMRRLDLEMMAAGPRKG